MAKKKKSKQSGISERFLERLDEMFGATVSCNVQKTFVERPTTFRINTIKSNKEEVFGTLLSNGFKVDVVPWYKDAFILRNKTKRELCSLPLYTEGKIYVQSLASMVPPLVLDPKPGEKVLDLTAAPGSKTSQIAALMKTEGELIANDNNKVRFFKLKHNMEALGVANERENWKFKLRMEHGAALCHEFPEYFDKILLDAPCSAEARFVASDPKTFSFWSERKIKETAFKQRKLLYAAWQALKPGGTLVYSTCTFAPEENEIQISRIASQLKDSCKILSVSIEGLQKGPIVKEWKGKTIEKAAESTLRLLPNNSIEGFYIAKLQKQEK